MAIKITKSFTSPLLGELTEAIVRIENYRIEKLTGEFQVTLAMFRNITDADTFKFQYVEDLKRPLQARPKPPIIVPPAILVDGVEKEYPTYLIFPLTVDEVTDEMVNTYEDIKTIETYIENDEDGNPVEKTREKTTRVIASTDILIKHRIDITVVGSDPYGWAYSKMKPYFEEIFGAENIIDC